MGLSPDDACLSFVAEHFDKSIAKDVDGVLSLDGKIYLAPHNATHVLCVDPGRRSVRLVGTAMGNSGVGLFRGSGVRARNGRIFFAPCDFHSVLCIHAEGDTQLFALAPPPRSLEYLSGGVLAKNGHIFFSSGAWLSDCAC